MACGFNTERTRASRSETWYPLFFCKICVKAVMIYDKHCGCSLDTLRGLAGVSVNVCRRGRYFRAWVFPGFFGGLVTFLGLLISFFFFFFFFCFVPPGFPLDVGVCTLRSIRSVVLGFFLSTHLESGHLTSIDNVL